MQSLKNLMRGNGFDFLEQVHSGFDTGLGSTALAPWRESLPMQTSSPVLPRASFSPPAVPMETGPDFQQILRRSTSGGRMKHTKAGIVRKSFRHRCPDGHEFEFVEEMGMMDQIDLSRLMTEETALSGNSLLDQLLNS